MTKTPLNKAFLLKGVGDDQFVKKPFTIHFETLWDNVKGASFLNYHRVAYSSMHQIHFSQNLRKDSFL